MCCLVAVIWNCDFSQTSTGAKLGLYKMGLATAMPQSNTGEVFFSMKHY
jgi:hypothetical protein